MIRGAAALVHPSLWLAAAALAGLALVRGRRLGRLVREPLPVVVRAIETTRARGALYRRSRDTRRAGAILRSATLARLRRRLGLPSHAPADVVAERLAVLTGRSQTAVAAVLTGPLPADEAALGALARDLTALGTSPPPAPNGRPVADDHRVPTDPAPVLAPDLAPVPAPVPRPPGVPGPLCTPSALGSRRSSSGRMRPSPACSSPCWPGPHPPRRRPRRSQDLARPGPGRRARRRDHPGPVHPDLMPGDITGSLIFDAGASEFTFREGPVFTNLLLADEINRTPPKTQSALLGRWKSDRSRSTGVRGPFRSPFSLRQPRTRWSTRAPTRCPRPSSTASSSRRSSTCRPRPRDRGRPPARVRFRPRDLAAAGVRPVASAADLAAGTAAVKGVAVSDEVASYIVDIARATRVSPR